MALQQGLILNGQEVVNSPVVSGDTTHGSISPTIHSSGNQILSIYGDGTGYVRIGSVGGASKPNVDFYVYGITEMYDVQYFISKSVHDAYIESNVLGASNGFIFTISTVGAAWNKISSSYEQMVHAIGSLIGRQFIICDYASRDQDFDHTPQTNPTLYIQSATEPDTNNTQWLSLIHNQTNAVIATGLGDMILDPVSEITEVCGTGLKTKEYNAVVNDDATISLPTTTTGWGEVMIGDNQEFANFRWTSDAVVTLGNEATTNVVTTDTDTNLCIFDGGSSVSIRNRLGSNLTVRYVIHYS
jgi:hypothetical protein